MEAGNFIGKYLHHIVHTSENWHARKKFISFSSAEHSVSVCRFYLPAEKRFCWRRREKGGIMLIQKVFSAFLCFRTVKRKISLPVCTRDAFNEHMQLLVSLKKEFGGKNEKRLQ